MTRYFFFDNIPPYKPRAGIKIQSKDNDTKQIKNIVFQKALIQWNILFSFKGPCSHSTFQLLSTISNIFSKKNSTVFISYIQRWAGGNKM